MTSFAIPPGLSDVGAVRSTPPDRIICGVHLSAKYDALLAGVSIESSASPTVATML